MPEASSFPDRRAAFVERLTQLSRECGVAVVCGISEPYLIDVYGDEGGGYREYGGELDWVGTPQTLTRPRRHFGEVWIRT